MALAARDEQALDGLTAELTGAGGRVIAVPTDVTDAAAVAWLCSDDDAFVTGDVAAHWSVSRQITITSDGDLPRA